MTIAPLPQRITSDNAQADRRRQYELNRNYYNGIHAANRGASRRAPVAVRNLIALFIDTTTAHIGQPTVSFGDDANAQQLEDYYADTISESGGEQLEFDIELGCSVDGDGVTKVTWNDVEQRVRVADVDPRGVYVQHRPGEPNTIDLVAQQYQVTETDLPIMFPNAVTTALGRNNKATVTEAWTVDAWEIWLGDILMLQERNPYGGLIPYVIQPNTRGPRAFWGTGDPATLIALQDQLNKAHIDLDWTMELAGNIVKLTGVDNTGNLTYTPGAIWNLPEGATADILEITKGNGIAQRLSYNASIQDTMHAIARVPHTAIGDTGGSALSGLALQIQLGPLARLIARKRLSRTAALRSRALLIAGLGAQFGGLPSMTARPSVSWRDVIPTDRGGELTNAETELRLGRSAEAVLRSVGVDDPAAELAARRQEVAAGLIGPAGASQGGFPSGPGQQPATPL